MALLVGTTWSLCGKQSQEDSHTNLALGFIVVGGALISMARKQSSVRSAEADSGSEDEYVKVERDDLMGVLVLE